MKTLSLALLSLLLLAGLDVATVRAERDAARRELADLRAEQHKFEEAFKDAMRADTGDAEPALAPCTYEAQ